MPLVLVAAIAMLLIGDNQRSMAFEVLLMFTTHGRPSEIGALTVDDVISPAAAAGAQFADASVIIRESELRVPTK
eukprot:2723604-Lingulodinium_polyedra.AAC.1